MNATQDISILSQLHIHDLRMEVLLTQVQLAVVPSAGEEEERKGQDGDEEHIQNAEEDESGGDADAVATVGETECDGVQEPEQVHPAG